MWGKLLKSSYDPLQTATKQLVISLLVQFVGISIFEKVESGFLKGIVYMPGAKQQKLKNENGTVKLYLNELLDIKEMVTVECCQI